MKYLTDEILNKYIDNELSAEENEMVSKILKNSSVDRDKYTSLIKIDEGLKKMSAGKLSKNFTSDFMDKLRLKTIRDKKQKRFIVYISSILVTVILALTGTALYGALSNNIGKGKGIDFFKDISFNTSFITKNIGYALSPDKISLIGISFSLVIIISLYFLLEEIKKTKHRLNKIL